MGFDPRAKDFDDALEILNLETTAGSLVRKYVLSIWDQVIEASEMLVAGAVIRTIKEVQFVDDEKEVSHISAKLTVGTGTGTTSVYDANLSVRNEQVLSLDLVAEGETLNLKPSSVEESEGDLAAKLAALQEILGS